MSKRRVLCKFFAHGACLKGENCEFSHDWKAPPNNICTFYQKGNCAYGSQCRYAHAKVSQLQSPASGSSSVSHPHQYSFPGSAAVPHTLTTVSDGVSTRSGAYTSDASLDEHFVSMTSPVWSEQTTPHALIDGGGIREPTSVDPCDRSLCSFAAAGSCSHGENCPHIHGDLCATCGKQCLHPFRPQEREKHRKTCEKRRTHLESLKRSQEIECCVCLERVLEKPTAAERKFGILSECDHPFCVSCIRYWRKSSPASGMDVNSTLRACPICRKLSYFVVPSVVWFFSKKEKEEIVDSYKAKLRSIDCKHFDFGNGTCPFGTSCFYKHTVKQGSHIWKTTRMPEVYGSRSLVIDEQESSSSWESSSLRLLFELLNASNMAVGLEEFGSLSNEDIENEIAEALAFELMFESLALSDSEIADDFTIC